MISNVRYNNYGDESQTTLKKRNGYQPCYPPLDGDVLAMQLISMASIKTLMAILIYSTCPVPEMVGEYKSLKWHLVIADQSKLEDIFPKLYTG